MTYEDDIILMLLLTKKDSSSLKVIVESEWKDIPMFVEQWGHGNNTKEEVGGGERAIPVGDSQVLEVGALPCHMAWVRVEELGRVE